ncbi:MAG TPA: FAD-binding protein [Candidatus Lokiarchaeia archaeon]|nr:FAD-binding protein [Candidatus Lokiarchaeia archaeon]
MGDKPAALATAKDQLRAAVARAALLEPIPRKTVPVTPEALVIGGGVGGLQAALDIANHGFKVHVVEKEPTIGGKMAMLDRTFPTDDCSI